MDSEIQLAEIAMNAIAQPANAGPATATITRRSLDQLEEDIISHSQHINATEYEFLVLLREFDLRQGWKAYHFNNCAEWLNMKCGIAPCTAREKLRVANALFDLPNVSRAFQKGDLSYTKARALTRVATPRDEEQLLDYALKATAAQVDRHCLELRNVRRDVSTADANRAHDGRYFSYSPNRDGSVRISMELPGEQAGLLLKALELGTSRLKSDDEKYLESELKADELSEFGGDASRDASALHREQADGIVEIARAYLAGGDSSESDGSKRSCSADHYQVTVHVDERALRGEPDKQSKSDLPIETVRRLCCDGAIVPLVEGETGKSAGLGRKHRVVNPQLRRALLARDRGCRFPGCTHTKWLDAHHVMHWADGGETTPENLVMLCSAHHRLLHEGGFEIKPGPNAQWQFRNASGRLPG